MYEPHELTLELSRRPVSVAAVAACALLTALVSASAAAALGHRYTAAGLAVAASLALLVLAVTAVVDAWQSSRAHQRVSSNRSAAAYWAATR